MVLLRRSLLLLAVLFVASGAEAAKRPLRPPATPSALRPFLLSPGEAPAHTFPRTPSFAWNPVRNAGFYEFELATSDTFNEGQIVFATNTLKAPTVSIPVALPWLTGRPYALYAHVRAIAPSGATKWRRIASGGLTRNATSSATVETGLRPCRRKRRAVWTSTLTCS